MHICPATLQSAFVMIICEAGRVITLVSIDGETFACVFQTEVGFSLMFKI